MGTATRVVRNHINLLKSMHFPTRSVFFTVLYLFLWVQSKLGEYKLMGLAPYGSTL